MCVACLKYTWWFYLPYLSFCLLSSTSNVGGAPSKWIRESRLWREYASYFPMRLEKHRPDLELKGDQPYLFGYHPHGIFGVGCYPQFAAHGSNFQELFPGLDMRVATLNVNMKLPFLRDILLKMGFISSDGASILNALGPKKAVTIVIGGAAEALLVHPTRHDLVLLRRKGFFRLALKSGACLVPVYSFGENNVYHTADYSSKPGMVLLNKITRGMCRFSVPFFYGQGFFGTQCGVTPLKREIVSVIGEPVQSLKIENPTLDDVNKLQAKYCESLKQAFDKFKLKYCSDPKSAELRFVE